MQMIQNILGGWFRLNWKSRLKYSLGLSLAVYLLCIIAVAVISIRLQVVPRSERILKNIGELVVIVYLLGGCIDIHSSKKKLAIMCLPLLGWIISYTFIYCSIPYSAGDPHNFIDHTNRYIRYYQWGVMVTGLLTSLKCIIDRKWGGYIRTRTWGMYRSLSFYVSYSCRVFGIFCEV